MQAARNFSLRNIRALLTEGFTDADLRRLCYDEPAFRPVYEQLAQDMGKDRIIDKLIEYAEQQKLIEILLAIAQKDNPAQYEDHQPYVLTGDFPISPNDHQRATRRLIIAGVMAAIVIIVAILFFIIKLSPPATIPIVKEFAIEYPGRETISVKPGGAIEIGFGEDVLIKPITANENGEQITWFIAKGDKQLVNNGIKYIAPLAGNRDVITVLVTSSPGAPETVASLHITITHN